MKKIIIGIVCLTLTACAQYKLIKKQSVSVNGITVTPTIEWNKSPANIGKNVEIWTVDGHSLNEFLILGGIPSGNSLFKTNNKELPMPAFKADMLPNELEDLVLTSLNNLMGGKLELTASNMRPENFAGEMGFRFNVNYFTEDGLAKQGDIVVSVRDGKLFGLVFIAAKMHYYTKYQAEIDSLIKTAKI